MLDKKERLLWCLNDLEEQTIGWLWPGRLPAAKLTLIDGDPSQGKSLMTLDLASRLTTTRSLPDGFTPPEPLSVVLVQRRRHPRYGVAAPAGGWGGSASGARLCGPGPPRKGLSVA
jgi:hypothetical protein